MARFSATLQHLGLVLLAALALGSEAAGQIEPERSEPRFLAQPITYDVVALFGEDTSKAIVNVHYRIGYDFFIFVRNEVPAQGAEYIARGELAVELLNEQKVSIAREIRPIALNRSSPVRDNDPRLELQGAISFSVEGGSYTVVFSLDDRESGRSFLDRNKRVTAPTPKLVPLEASQPILVQAQWMHPQWDDLVPANCGGDVIFGGRGGFLVQIFQPDTQQILAARWKLQGQLDGFGPRSQSFAGSDYITQNGLLKLAAEGTQMQYRTEPSSLGWRACFIPLPFEKLEPGSFIFDIEYSSGEVSRKQTQTFRVVWPNKPFSFANPELAIDALRYIASEEELSALQSGSSALRAEAFHGFWKAHDRDTTTAYNEVMAEYYYRVDEALRKFATLREGDGYKTDRGRIYILYGPPSKTEKVLRPGESPTEVWTYDRLKRRFVFIDPNKNGTYVLSQTEDL